MEYPRDDNQVLSSSNIEANISTLKQIVSIFNDSIALRSIGNERAEKMVSVTKSYICILVWLYENQYSYGSSAKFINSDMQAHYVLNKIVLDNYNNRKMVLKDLPSGWNSVLSVLNNMKISSKNDCDKILAIQSGISQLTDCFAYLSNL